MPYIGNSLTAQVGPAANHYLRVMEKVVNGSGDYISKESNYVYFPSISLR